jgi:hypothetical protein
LLKEYNQKHSNFNQNAAPTKSRSRREDWMKGHVVKLPKKENLSSCNNWKGIMLTSVPGKVLTKIILQMLTTTLYQILLDEQESFEY